MNRDYRGRFAPGKTVVSKGEKARRSGLRKKAKAALSGNRLSQGSQPRGKPRSLGRVVTTRTAARFRSRKKRR